MAGISRLVDIELDLGDYLGECTRHCGRQPEVGSILIRADYCTRHYREGVPQVQ